MLNVMQKYREAEKLKDAGQSEEAIRCLNEILEMDSTHVLSHLTLAVLLGKVGRHEQAIEHARRACELDPADPFNFTALSVTYQRAWAGTHNQAYIRLAEEAMAHSQMLEQSKHQ